MGSILIGYFKQAEAKGGLPAKVKLAMLTKMSGQVAEAAPDSPENIKLFEDALKQI